MADQKYERFNEAVLSRILLETKQSAVAVVERATELLAEREVEVERLTLALNQSETACGHLSADLIESQRLRTANIINMQQQLAEIERLARECERASDVIFKQRDEIDRLTLEVEHHRVMSAARQDENERLRNKLAVEQHENARWEHIADELETRLVAAQRLLREAVLRDGIVDERWFKEAAKAGGDGE